jgi:hypothetical protein
MTKKAPRIPDETWDRHKPDIIALYLAPKSTLDQTMQRMEETHGFRARCDLRFPESRPEADVFRSKNQYTTKLKAWGIGKNANASTWEFIDKVKRKRKLEGKDSEIVLYGRKQSRRKVEKEIARNVTFTSGRSPEDVPTPEGLNILTPLAETLAQSHREVYFENLPWLQFKRETQSLSMFYKPAWVNQRL